MEGKGVLHDLLVQLYFVGVVGDDVQLSEPLVVDERRRANLRAVLNIPVAIDVGDRLPVPRIAEQFHLVGNDGLVGVFISSASSCGNRLAKVSKARARFVLDDLVHVIHNKSMHEIPLQQGRGKQYLVATITTHEHATRRRHDVVLFGVISHERTDVVASYHRVLEYRLLLGKMILQFSRDADVTLDHTKESTV